MAESDNITEENSGSTTSGNNDTSTTNEENPENDALVQPADTPVTAAASSSQGGNVNTALERSLPDDSPDKEQSAELTVQERRVAAEKAVRDIAHVLGLGEEATKNAAFAAANMAEHNPRAGLKDVVNEQVSKATGIPQEVLNMAREQTKGMQFACATSTQGALCTFSALTNMGKQQGAQLQQQPS